MNRDDPRQRRLLLAELKAAEVKLMRETMVSTITFRVAMSQAMRDMMRRLEDEQS